MGKMILTYLLIAFLWFSGVNCGGVNLDQPPDLRGTWQIIRYKGQPMMPDAEKLGIDTAHHYLVCFPDSNLLDRGARPLLIELFTTEESKNEKIYKLETFCDAIDFNDIIRKTKNAKFVESYTKECTAMTIASTFQKASSGTFGHNKIYLRKGANCQGFATKFMGIFKSIT